MPWQNNGDFYSFKQDSIIQNAPTVSGVYGLFNFRHQIVIGSAANVRDALLHHRRHSKFRFRRFQPSGFTFEICPADRRENRAQELIKEYNPISSPQTPIGLGTLYRSWRVPQARAFNAEAPIKRTPVNKQIVAMPGEAEQKAPLQLTAERFGLAGALCGVVFLAVGVTGLVPHLKKMFDSVVRNPTAIAESRRQSAGGEIQLARAKSLNPATDTANTEGPVPPRPVELSTSANFNNQAISSSPTGWRTAAAQAATPALAATPEPQAETSAPPEKRVIPSNPWSVQAMATTDKQMANDWLQKLKAKGYEAFVVEADISGKTWHRVRVGTFETRQDAENLRSVLKAKEGIRDAYVASSDKAATTIALNRR